MFNWFINLFTDDEDTSCCVCGGPGKHKYTRQLITMVGEYWYCDGCEIVALAERAEGLERRRKSAQSRVAKAKKILSKKRKIDEKDI